MLSAMRLLTTSRIGQCVQKFRWDSFIDGQVLRPGSSIHGTVARAMPMITTANPPISVGPRQRRARIIGSRQTNRRLIREYLDNPFFSWSEYGEAISRRACQIYNVASAAIDTPDTSATTADVQALMKSFVHSFNCLGSRHDIDSIMAEKIGQAFDELVLRRAETTSVLEASKWFDTWRDF